MDDARRVTMGHDRDTVSGMDTIAVSKFKATCLARLERVRQTGRPLLITTRGVVIAQALPPPREPGAGAFGVLAGRAVGPCDIVAPLDEEEWESLRRPAALRTCWPRMSGSGISRGRSGWADASDRAGRERRLTLVTADERLLSAARLPTRSA